MRPWIVIAVVGGVCLPPTAAAQEEACLPPRAEEVARCPAREAAPPPRRRPRPPVVRSDDAPRDRGTAPGVEIDMGAARSARAEPARYAILVRELRVLDRLVAHIRDADPGRPNVIRRLAITHFEGARAATIEITRLEEAGDAARRRRNAPEAARLERELGTWRTRLEEHRGGEVRAWAMLIRDYPGAADADEALYALARGLEELGEAERAVQSYHRLLRDHPASRFVPYAWLAFAERAFAAGDVTSAIAFYDRVLAFPDSPLYRFALYKQAWCHYNLRAFDASLASFVRVVEHATAHPDPQAAAMARGARRELVLPYAEAGRPERALELFGRLAADDDEAIEMLGALAQVYEDTGRWDPAIASYHRLMSERPRSPELCRWQERVTRAVLASRPKPDQLREVRRLVDVQQRSDEPACGERAATVVIELATAWHREAIGTDAQPGTADRRTMELALALYDLALDAFPALDQLDLARFDRRDRPDRAALAFFRAELLWAMDDFERCGAAYDAVSDGPFADEARRAAVLCYMRLWQATRGATPPGPVSPDAPVRALDPLEERMLAAFSRYVCQVPGGPDAVAVRYRHAYLLYEAGRWAEAAVLFREVALRHAEHEVGPYAANLYLDSLNALGRHEPVRRDACVMEIEASLGTIEELYCDDGGPDHLCRIVSDLRCQTLRLGAERVGRSERHREAADLIMTIVDDHPTCPGADEMLENAAIHYEAARLLGRAIVARERLVREHPESTLVGQALHRLGGNYHAIAVYDRAARAYEELARRFPGHDGAAEALGEALVFRLGLGELEEARADVALLEGGRSAVTAARASYALGAALEGRDERDALLDHDRAWLRRYARRAPPHLLLAVRVRLARTLQRRRDRDGSLRELREVVARFEAGALAQSTEDDAREGRDAVAEALFRLGEDRYRTFAGIELPAYSGGRSLSSVDRWAQGPFADWIERRRAALLEAEEAYNRVAPLDVPRWAIAAAARVGEMYASFISVIRAAPIPREIEEDDELVNLYLGRLEQLVRLFEVPARDRFEFCLRSSTSLRFFSDDTRRCERELHELDPERYPIAEELRGAPTYERSAQQARPATLSDD